MSIKGAPLPEWLQRVFLSIIFGRLAIVMWILAVAAPFQTAYKITGLGAILYGIRSNWTGLSGGVKRWPVLSIAPLQVT